MNKKEEQGLINITPYQWKPGESGNPNGRPPKINIPEIESMLAKILSEEANGRSAAMIILEKVREMACKGDLKAAELLLNRAYGLPKQLIDMEIKKLFKVTEPDE